MTVATQLRTVAQAPVIFPRRVPLRVVDESIAARNRSPK